MSRDGDGECEGASSLKPPSPGSSTVIRYVHQQRFLHFQHHAQPEIPTRIPHISVTNRLSKLLFLLSRLQRPPAIPEAPPPDQEPENEPCPRQSRELLPPWICRRLTFYRLHWAYFITVAAIASILIWIFPKPSGGHRLSFVDSLYTAVSTTCTTGLISVRMQDFSIPDTILMLFLMIMGSPIFTSVLPLYFRQYQFRKNICELEHHLGLCSCGGANVDPHAESDVEAELGMPPPGLCGLHKRVAAAAARERRSAGGAGEDSGGDPIRAALDATLLEYEAIVALNWVVSAYFLACVVIGFLVLVILFQTSEKAVGILRSNGVNPNYFAIYQTISAFTNSGILLLNDNMVPLREFNGVLLWSSVLILIGNTMFAPCLRVLIWVLRRFSSAKRERVYDYLLKNPRRCFTHLFPRKETIWLVVTVMAFNAFESMFFWILSWKSDGLDGLDLSQKVVNGIFQSITTRSAGENVVAIGTLSPSMLVLYIAMMYIAVYPVYLSRQNSQAEEQLIEEVISTKKPKKKKKKKKGEFHITTQSKRLIARDSAFLFISVFVLCIIENRRIDKDPLNFSIFNIIFEVISAYGNVGLSVGYSCSLLKKITSNADDNSCVDVPYSFSGKWSLSGKLLMIVIMFLGRHRGLPDNMDSALQIPKSFFSVENQQRRQSNAGQQQQPPEQNEFIVEVPEIELGETKFVSSSSASSLSPFDSEQQHHQQELQADDQISHHLQPSPDMVNR